MVLRKLSQTLMVSLAFMVATFSSGLLQPAVAYATPANNGTLKVHEKNTASGTESNDPKVCAFNFEGFGFDVGQEGYIQLDGQGQTSGNFGDFAFGPTVANPTHLSYAETLYFNDGTGTYSVPDGHYKATLYGKRTSGGINLEDEKAKSKVFKVECAPIVVLPAGNLTVNVTCEAGSFSGTVTAPADGVATYKVNGNVTTPGLYTDLTPGSYTVEMFVNGTLVDTETVTVVACEDEIEYITTPEVLSEVICGPDNDEYSVVDGDNYSVVDNLDGSFMLTADTGFVFEANGLTTLTVYGDEDTNTVCPPSVCTVSNNTYITAWTFDGSTFPEAGGGGAFEFKTDGLHLSTPVLDSYVYGLTDGGNTPLKDVDAMSYETFRKIESAGYQYTAPAYILVVDINGATAGGEKYFFYEPYNNSPPLVQEGVWQTWDTLDGGDAIWWMSGTGQTLRTWDYFVNEYPDAVVLAYGFNQGTYNAETYSAVQDLTFDCATTTFGTPGSGSEEPEVPVTPTTPTTPGQVQGTTTTATPQTLGTAILPAVLPATGGVDSPFMIVVASILAYGAAYFLQGRRLIARNEAIQA